MITFSLLGNHGRLGNQMFQYALIKSIAAKNNFVFAIPKQNHQLFDCFDIKCKVYDLEKHKDSIKKMNVYRESRFDFCEDVFECGDNFDYVGNYQSEKYFSEIKNEVIKDFTFKNSILEEAKSILNKYKKNNKIVAMHVRRGDYVNLQNFHPLCELKYYHEALNNFKDCDIICVSDDIEWCKNNFKNIDNINFCDSASSPYVDLCLMSICDHNIIANSSFSWWAAYLNKNEQKKIVTPKLWFGPSYSHLETKDLYCKNWVTI